VPTSAQTVLPSVTGEGDVLLPRPLLSAPSAMLRFHATLPVFRSAAMSHCLLSASGLMTKTSPPETIGVAPLTPGMSSDHFTPSVVLHFDGRPVSGEVPLKSGPRHCAQSAALVMDSKERRTRSGRFMSRREVSVGFSV
jgi:hypothetical protein